MFAASSKGKPTRFIRLQVGTRGEVGAPVIEPATIPDKAHTGRLFRIPGLVTRAWPPETGVRAAESLRLATGVCTAILVLIVGVTWASMVGQ